MDNALAFHPIDRLLYYATGYASNSGGPPRFASVDPGTARVTPIPTCGELIHSSRALTWLGGDVLFYVDRNRSFRSLTTRGALKTLGQMDHLSKGLAFVRNVSRSNLSLTQAADVNSVRVGRSIVFTMHVTNEGSQSVSGVMLRDTLPATASLVAATPSQGACSMAACGELTCNLGDLGSGDTVTVAVEVRPFATGTVSNSARVGGFNDADPSDNSSVATVRTRGRSSLRKLVSLGAFGRPAILLHLVDPTDASTGSIVRLTLEGASISRGSGLAVDAVTGELWALVSLEGQEESELVVLYPATGKVRHVGSMTVTNRGSGLVPDVVVTDELPHGIRFVAASASQGACAPDECQANLVCALGDLEGGAQVSLTIEVTPLVAGTFTNTVTVPALYDPDFSDNGVMLEATAVATDSERVLVSIVSFSPLLQIVDPIDGSTLSSRPIQLPGTELTGARGLATHPMTGELWSVVRLEDRSTEALVVIDPSTGIARRIGDTAEPFVSLSFDTDGTLYGVTNDVSSGPSTLFVIDQEDAQATPLLSSRAPCPKPLPSILRTASCCMPAAVCPITGRARSSSRPLPSTTSRGRTFRPVSSFRRSWLWPTWTAIRCSWLRRCRQRSRELTKRRARRSPRLSRQLRAGR